LAWHNSPVLGSKPIDQVQLNEVSFGEWGGFAQSSYDATSFVCFTPGTRIRTPTGEVPVQHLGVGDLVETVDRGPQPLIWLGDRTLHFPEAKGSPQPVEIKRGALGQGMPRKRLVLSPQHRILLSGVLVERVTSGLEASAPAHSLAHFPLVRRMLGARMVTYHSLLLERHEVIFAEGAPVESLFVGPMAVEALTPIQRLEIVAGMRTQAVNHASYKLARRSIRPREVRRWPAEAMGTNLCHVQTVSTEATPS
jgi:hypothetical protein